MSETGDKELGEQNWILSHVRRSKKASEGRCHLNSEEKEIPLPGGLVL